MTRVSLPARAAVREYNRTFGPAASWKKVGEWTFRELPPDHTLHRKEGDSFTIADIQHDPWKYHGWTCADPIEGLDYSSKAPAIIYTNSGRIEIYSLAHGGAFAYFAPIDISKTTFGDALRKWISEHDGAFVEGLRQNNRTASGG